MWRRGYWQIDNLIISHADLDHFNGVMALMERFSIRRVSVTPSFSERLTPAVQMTLASWKKKGIPIQILKAGDTLDEERLPSEVWHPPALGPEGKENYRSMVLLLRQEKLTILLTGDLEGPGLDRVLAMRAPPVDILMAPHHGSKTTNTPKLANWAKPKIAISSQGPPRGNPKIANPYEAAGSIYLTTWKHGAVTIRKEGDEWWATTYLTKKRLPLTAR